jgi:hypothetical protein
MNLNFSQVLNTVIAAFLIGVGTAFVGGYNHLTSFESRLTQVEKQYASTVPENRKNILDHNDRITANTSTIAVHDSRLRTLEVLYEKSVVANRIAVAEHATRLAVIELHVKLHKGNGNGSGQQGYTPQPEGAENKGNITKKKVSYPIKDTFGLNP